MDTKKAAQIGRAAQQTVDTLWLNKEQARLNRERREQAREAEVERLWQDNARLYASLRRMANGMHAGDHGDAKAALDEASALLGELGGRYER